MYSAAAMRRAATQVAYLRRLARNPAAGEHEAAAARDAAANLIAKFGLRDHEVSSADSETERIDKRPFLRDFNQWQKHLAFACATFCGGNLRMHVEGAVAVIMATGTPSQRHATVAMYASLERAVLGARVPTRYDVFGSEIYEITTRHLPDRWELSFRTGYAQGIKDSIAATQSIRDRPRPGAMIVRPIDFDLPRREDAPPEATIHTQWPERAPAPKKAAPPPPVASPWDPPPPVAPAAPKRGPTGRTPSRATPPAPNEPAPAPPPPPKGIASEDHYVEVYRYGRRLGQCMNIEDPCAVPQRRRA
ncbi:MAG: hypothetical protein ACHREM_08990 [Polyangiales bacterium]